MAGTGAPRSEQAQDAYANLPPEVVAITKRAADRIRECRPDAVIDKGRELLAVKAALPRGRFGAWLAAEFAGSARTARNMMAAAEVFGDASATVAALEPRILYRLATAPADIRQKFVAHVNGGGRTNFHAVAYAARRCTDPQEEARRWESRWYCQKDAAERFCKLLKEDLQDWTRRDCLNLLEVVDVDDVLHAFGRKREKPWA